MNFQIWNIFRKTIVTLPNPQTIDGNSRRHPNGGGLYVANESSLSMLSLFVANKIKITYAKGILYKIDVFNKVDFE